MNDKATKQSRGQRSEGNRPPYHPQPKQLEIFRMLINNASYNLICKSLNVKKFAISKAKRRFIKHGLLQEQNDIIYLTQKGKNLMQLILVQGLRGQQLERATQPDTDRLHHLDFVMPVKRSELLKTKWKTERQKLLKLQNIDYKQMKLKHHTIESFYIDNIEIRTTDKSVIIRGIEAYGHNGQVSKNKAIEILRIILPKVENIFKIKLDAPNKVCLYVSSQEHAFIENVWANQVNQLVKKGIIHKFEVYNENGELIAISDRSNGTDELEFVHKIESEEHANKMKEEIYNIVNGKTEAFRNKTEERLAKIEKALEEKYKFENKFVDYIG